MKLGTRIRLIEDSCGDLPKRYLQKKGTVIGYEKHPLEFKYRAYEVKNG